MLRPPCPPSLVPVGAEPARHDGGTTLGVLGVLRRLLVPSLCLLEVEGIHVVVEGEGRVVLALDFLDAAKLIASLEGSSTASLEVTAQSAQVLVAVEGIVGCCVCWLGCLAFAFSRLPLVTVPSWNMAEAGLLLPTPLAAGGCYETLYHILWQLLVQACCMHLAGAEYAPVAAD